MLVAEFSIVGGPLLASFPIQGALFASIFAASPLLAIWAFIGNLGFLLAGFRSLSTVAIQTERGRWTVDERFWEAVLLCIGVTTLLVIGLFPQLFLPGLMKLLELYPHLL